MTHSPDHAERVAEAILTANTDSATWRKDLLDAILLLQSRRADQQVRECQSVWRCAVGDSTGALDVLKGRWEKSRRKHEREAGAALAGVLDLVWAARDPAAGNYSEAAANGKKLVERVRAALHDAKEEGNACPYTTAPRREGDEWACRCGKRWPVGEEHP